MNIDWEEHYNSETILNSDRFGLASIKWRNNPDDTAVFSIIIYIIHWFSLFLTFKRLNKKNQKILDIGAGPSTFRNLFLKTGASYTGFDISDKIIQRNKKTYNQHEFYCHSVIDTPFPNAPFEIIVANMVLQHISEKEQNIALLNIFQNLSKGGIFILIEGNKNDEYINFFTRKSDEWIMVCESIGFSNYKQISLMCFPLGRLLLFFIKKTLIFLKLNVNLIWVMNFLLAINLPLELLIILIQFCFPASTNIIKKMGYSQTLFIIDK